MVLFPKLSIERDRRSSHYRVSNAPWKAMYQRLIFGPIPLAGGARFDALMMLSLLFNLGVESDKRWVVIF